MKNVNNFLSIGAKDMKTPPLDASHYDESNKLCFIFLWSIDYELHSYKKSRTKNHYIFNIMFMKYDFKFLNKV